MEKLEKAFDDMMEAASKLPNLRVLQDNAEKHEELFGQAGQTMAEFVLLSRTIYIYGNEGVLRAYNRESLLEPWNGEWSNVDMLHILYSVCHEVCICYGPKNFDAARHYLGLEDD